MRRSIKSSPSQIRDMAKLYEQGTCILDIGSQINVSVDVVRRSLRKSGFVLSTRKATTEIQKKQIVAEYETGVKTAELCERYDLSNSTIWGILKKSGVDIRNQADGVARYSSEIIALYEAGKSVDRIVEHIRCNREFLVSKEPIYKLLRKAGVEVRTQAVTTKRNWQDPKYAQAVNSKRPDRTGEKSHFWQGGKTKLSTLIRSSERYFEWRKAIFIRDRFTCQHCGARNGRKRVIEADHIYPFSALIRDNKITTREQAMECEALWDIDNGRTLCKSCHEKTDTYLNGAKKYLKD